MSSGTWDLLEAMDAERPPPCEECRRLRQARHAASVLGDIDWLAKIADEQRAHRVTVHGQAM